MIEMLWEETLKLLEGTFILTSKSNSSLVSSFYNPSVFDFLLDKVRSYEDVQDLLIRNALFADQVYNTFSDIPSADTHMEILINAGLYPSVINAYEYATDHFRVCSLRESGSVLVKNNISLAGYIVQMQNSFKVLFKNNPQLINSIVDQGFLECGKYSLLDRMTLFDRLDKEGRAKLDLEHLSSVVYEQADWADDFVNILDLLELTEFGRKALESDEMLERVENTLEFELESATNEEECDMIGGSASLLAEKILGLSADTWERSVDEAKLRFPCELDYDDIDEDWARESYYSSRASEDKAYSEMFTSLLEK